MANLTNIEDANKMIDDLTKSLAAATESLTALQTKHSELITQNGNLVKEKSELWDLVASGKKPVAGKTEVEKAAIESTENKLEELEM